MGDGFDPWLPTKNPFWPHITKDESIQLMRGETCLDYTVSFSYLFYFAFLIFLFELYTFLTLVNNDNNNNNNIIIIIIIIIIIVNWHKICFQLMQRMVWTLTMMTQVQLVQPVKLVLFPGQILVWLCHHR